MVCTEQEAFKKWCPHARMYSGENGVVCNRNHFTSIPQYTTCLGSRCMNWVWMTEPGSMRDVLGGQWVGCCGLTKIKEEDIEVRQREQSR